jgi:hypothetical protein
MEMLQTQMDRSSFELKPLQEWEVTQEKEGGKKEEVVVVEMEQALVVVLLYAPLRPRSLSQAAAPLPDDAADEGGGSKEGCFFA